MFPPIGSGAAVSALSEPAGWIELALLAACFAIAWRIDRGVNLQKKGTTEAARIGLAGIDRLVFPLSVLALLLPVLAAFRLFHEPFFLSLALPLVVALALIRLLVFALRGVFGGAAWLKTSERALSFAIWSLVVLHYVGVTPKIAAELDAMQVSVGRSHVSVLEIGKAIVVVLVTIAVTLWLSGLVEQRLARAGAIDANLRVVLSKFLRALIVVIGVLFALQAVGIDLTLLSVFGGALGVGIGLGLQKLASNYIAGFTILLDRSIRMGDMITVDGRHGVVTSVTSRYVVVRSLDGIEAIVPNETLVTTTVLNHSYTSRNARIAIPVQITYDSDVDTALRILAEAASAQPRVLKSPNPPTAFVLRFGEIGIDLELGIWVADPENGQTELRSAINRAIFVAFREHGIRIPVAVREARIGDARNRDIPPRPRA